MKRNRGPLGRRSKAMIALFAATAALGGGAGALSPAGAGAMIDDGNLTQAECFRASGIWDNIGETCELPIGAGEGGGGGGPSYGGLGGGGGSAGGGAGSGSGSGSGAGSGSGSGGPAAPGPSSQEDRAAARRAKELEALLEQVRQELSKFHQEVCKRHREKIKDIRGEWLDGTLIRHLRGGSKKERIQREKAMMEEDGCN
jgi:hypothetical protein